MPMGICCQIFSQIGPPVLELSCTHGFLTFRSLWPWPLTSKQGWGHYFCGWYQHTIRWLPNSYGKVLKSVSRTDILIQATSREKLSRGVVALLSVQELLLASSDRGRKFWYKRLVEFFLSVLVALYPYLSHFIITVKTLTFWAVFCHSAAGAAMTVLVLTETRNHVSGIFGFSGFIFLLF